MVVPIAVLLPVQQFYITKIMMLVFSIAVTCPYLYSVCLVYRVLKNTYFKEYISVVASKYCICNTENNTQEFKLCLNIALWKRHYLGHQRNKAPVEKALRHQWNKLHGS